MLLIRLETALGRPVSPLSDPLGRHLARTVLRWRKNLKAVARPRDRAQRVVDIPLVLHFVGILRPHSVHLLDHLVVVGAEVAFAAL
jgi:hypothetical protein